MPIQATALARRRRRCAPLRAAIAEANSAPANTPTIRFSVAGTIDISSGGNLPTLNVAGMLIEGALHPDTLVSSGPTVAIKGNSDTVNAQAGLTLNAGNTTIRGTVDAEQAPVERSLRQADGGLVEHLPKAGWDFVRDRFGMAGPRGQSGLTSPGRSGRRAPPSKRSR